MTVDRSKGKRGRGRPRVYPLDATRPQVIMAQIDDIRMLEEIDAIGAAEDRSRSKVINHLLREALDARAAKVQTILKLCA